MELAYGADPAQLARLLVAACELDEERRRARSAEEREEELALSLLLLLRASPPPEDWCSPPALRLHQRAPSTSQGGP